MASIDASQSISCAASSRSVATGLTPVTVAPAAIAPSAAMTHSGELGAQMASTSPAPRPRAASPAAARSMRAASAS